jgi:predicted dehydrogenase
MIARKKVNLGVVGLGYWGPNLVRNFGEVDNCHVVMVCDKEEARLKPIRRRYPSIEVTTNYQDMVSASSIDAIAIATPVVSHYELAKQALERGKHVMVEKPLCANVGEAEELIKIAQRHGKILMVGHTFLYTSSVRKAKELISKGEIGELYYFDSVRINLGLFRSDVNVIWDLAPHDISIARYLIDEEPVSVSVLGRDFGNNNIECMAYITLKYRSGKIAHIHVSWLSPVKIRRIIIGGSKRMIIYDDVEPTEKIRVYDRGIEFDYNKENPLQPTYRLGDINLPRLDQREALLVEAEHFIDCILNGKKPLTDAAFGLAVLKVLEASDVSLKEGGREVMLSSD